MLIFLGAVAVVILTVAPRALAQTPARNAACRAIVAACKLAVFVQGASPPAQVSRRLHQVDHIPKFKALIELFASAGPGRLVG